MNTTPDETTFHEGHITHGKILDLGESYHLRYMISMKYNPDTYVSSPELIWCLKQFGNNSRYREWDTVRGVAHTTQFYFKQHEDAMEFVLVWC